MMEHNLEVPLKKVKGKTSTRPNSRGKKAGALQYTYDKNGRRVKVITASEPAATATATATAASPASPTSPVPNTHSTRSGSGNSNSNSNSSSSGWRSPTTVELQAHEASSSNPDVRQQKQAQQREALYRMVASGSGGGISPLGDGGEADVGYGAMDGAAAADVGYGAMDGAAAAADVGYGALDGAAAAAAGAEASLTELQLQYYGDAATSGAVYGPVSDCRLPMIHYKDEGEDGDATVAPANQTVILDTGPESDAGAPADQTQTLHSDPQFDTITLPSPSNIDHGGDGYQQPATDSSPCDGYQQPATDSSPRRPQHQTTAAAQASAGAYSPNTRLEMLAAAVEKTPRQRINPPGEHGGRNSSSLSTPSPLAHTTTTSLLAAGAAGPSSVMSALTADTTPVKEQQQPEPAAAAAESDAMEDMCNFDGFQLSCIDLELEAIPAALAIRYGRLAKRLDLSSNKLCNLSNLRKFMHLEDLVLDNNRISDDSFFLPSLPNLVALSLNKNRISNLDTFLDVVSVSCPNLTFLSLVSNPACPNELVWGKDEDDYIRYRCMVVSKIPTLKFLDSLVVTAREFKASRKKVGMLGKMAAFYNGTASSTAAQYTDHSTATLAFFKGRQKKKMWSMWLSKQCVLGLAPLSDKWIVACGTDGSIRVFDLTPGKWENKCVAILKGHTARVRAVASFADVRVVSCADDRTIRIWDLGAQKCLRVYRGHRSGVACVIALPDGRVVSGGDDGTVRVWSASSNRCTATLTGHHGMVLSVAHVGSRHIASGSSDETIKIWDISGKFCRRTLKGHTGDVLSLVTLPNQKLVSASADKTIKVWNPLENRGKSRSYKAGNRTIRTPDLGTFEASLQGHTAAVTSVSSLSDTRILSASDDKMVAVWDLTTMRCVSVFAGHEDAVVDAIWLPDGRVASSSREIKIWDRMTHTAQSQSQQITDAFNAVGDAPASSLWHSTRTGLKGMVATILGVNNAGADGANDGGIASGAGVSTAPADAAAAAATESTAVSGASPADAASAADGDSSGAAAESGEKSQARNLMNVLFASTSDKWPSLPNNVLWERVKAMQAAVRKKKGPKVIHWLGIFKARQTQDLVARLDEMCRQIGVERITYLAVKQTLVEEFGEEIFERMKEQVSVELAMREFELTNGGSTTGDDKRLENLASPSKSYFPETKQAPSSASPKAYVENGAADDDEEGATDEAGNFLTEFFQGQENYATQSDIGDDEDLRSELDATMIELDAGSHVPQVQLTTDDPTELFKAALPNSTFFDDVADPLARFAEPLPEPEPEVDPEADVSMLIPNFKLRNEIEI